jgi:hypothetical protein
VAGFTLGSQLLAVLVCMAAQACLRQPEHGAFQVDIRFPRLEICGYKLGLVTGSAFQFGVTAHENVTCQGMVELIHSLRPVNELKVSPHMIAVAHHTGLIHFGMVAQAILHASVQVLMTGEALGFAGSLAEFVTLGTIRESFKRGVWLGQITRRKLGPCPGGRQYHKGTYDHAQEDRVQSVS